MSRSVERILEEAHLSGDLKLNGRKLREFPSTDKYDLSDTVFADLSRNRFVEVPSEITRFWCLEHLNLHHNTIRSVPDSITILQSLVFLDISHNQLHVLPSSICHLPLEILLVSNNKLQSLPTELGYCKTLTELDVSCNQINRLPPQLGLLSLLRSFNIRCNLLLELPLEITYLRLTRLDISRNRIASIPVEFKNMSCLEILRLSDNPLMAPPAVVCARGMVHVFKWLELRCTKPEKKQVAFQSENKSGRRKYNDVPRNQGLMMYPGDENTLHSKILEKNSLEHDINDKNNSMKSGITKSFDVQSVSMQKNFSCDNQPTEKGHLQTYREYKESLRLQRTVDSVYKCPQKEASNYSKPVVLIEPATESKVSFPEPVMKTFPVKENIRVEKTALIGTTPGKSRSSGDAVGCTQVKSNSSSDPIGTSQVKSRSSSDIPYDKMQFTMRREYEKAKEEAELIRQLRSTIESRLKVVLPENLSYAFCDGVVLCHFANHIMPHSVASIHVPSPTVPKLTTARARRNVDNFLEACRKIGVEEKLICCAGDILEGKSLAQVAITVSELLHRYSKTGAQDPAA